LRSKSPELLYQELYGLLLANSAVRAWMHEAPLQADLDPDRLSFIHALQVLDTCIGYLGYPFQNKQGKSCVENLVRDVDKEEKIGGVVIVTSLLEDRHAK